MKLISVVSTSLSKEVTKGFLCKDDSVSHTTAQDISPDEHVDPDEVVLAIPVHVIYKPWRSHISNILPVFSHIFITESVNHVLPVLLQVHRITLQYSRVKVKAGKGMNMSPLMVTNIQITL